jgi:hypothetical protein
MDRTGIPRRLHNQRGRCAALAAGGAAVIFTLGAAAGSATASAHSGAVTNDPGSLSGVATVSATDAWAAGDNDTGGAMILHWDGTSWAHAAIPSIADSSLDAISADSADDAWAVGMYETVTGGSVSSQLLVLHWDGTRWTRVTTPSTGQQFNGLTGVSAVSPTDVWAVGNESTPSVAKSLVLHWNGSRWTRIPLPHVPGIYLYSVDALSHTNVWASGDSAGKRLVLRWNGAQWSVMRSTKPGELKSVAALSATDAWAVGEIKSTLVVYCDGTSCSRVASPNPGNAGSPASRFHNLAGVIALSPSNAWAVGSYGAVLDGGKVQESKTLITAWNGTSWTQVASPSVGKYSTLSGIAASSASQAWAVGAVGTGNKSQVLILNWNGTSWTQS